MFERFLWRKGQQWTAAGAGKLGAADLGMAWALLEEVTINPTIQLQELKQDWVSHFCAWGLPSQL